VSCGNGIIMGGSTNTIKGGQYSAITGGHWNTVGGPTRKLTKFDKFLRDRLEYAFELAGYEVQINHKIWLKLGGDHWASVNFEDDHVLVENKVVAIAVESVVVHHSKPDFTEFILATVEGWARRSNGDD